MCYKETVYFEVVQKKIQINTVVRNQLSRGFFSGGGLLVGSVLISTFTSTFDVSSSGF